MDRLVKPMKSRDQMLFESLTLLYLHDLEQWCNPYVQRRLNCPQRVLLAAFDLQYRNVVIISEVHWLTLDDPSKGPKEGRYRTDH